MAKDKRPKSKEQVSAEKKPKSGIPESPQKLVWSFSVMDFDGPFGWNNCDAVEKFLEIFRRKKEFEGMSFNDLSKTESHAIPSWKLSKPARDRLEELNLDDWDEVFSLRITARNRIFCLKDGTTMRVLWWDPEHQVYPVGKKNT